MSEPRAMTTDPAVAGVCLVVVTLIVGGATWSRGRPERLANRAAFTQARQRWSLETTPAGHARLTNRLADPVHDVRVATSTPARPAILVLLGHGGGKPTPLTVGGRNCTDRVDPRGTLDFEIAHCEDASVEVEWTQPDGATAWSRHRI